MNWSTHHTISKNMRFIGFVQDTAYDSFVYKPIFVLDSKLLLFEDVNLDKVIKKIDLPGDVVSYYRHHPRNKIKNDTVICYYYFLCKTDNNDNILLGMRTISTQEEYGYANYKLMNIKPPPDKNNYLEYIFESKVDIDEILKANELNEIVGISKDANTLIKYDNTGNFLLESKLNDGIVINQGSCKQSSLVACTVKEFIFYNPVTLNLEKRMEHNANVSIENIKILTSYSVPIDRSYPPVFLLNNLAFYVHGFSKTVTKTIELVKDVESLDGYVYSNANSLYVVNINSSTVRCIPVKYRYTPLGFVYYGLATGHRISFFVHFDPATNTSHVLVVIDSLTRDRFKIIKIDPIPDKITTLIASIDTNDFFLIGETTLYKTELPDGYDSIDTKEYNH